MPYKLTYLLLFAVVLFSSCTNDKWRHVEILSLSNDQSITVITIGSARFIMDGKHEQVPESGYAHFDISTVDPIGDEIGICWNKDGYKWKFMSEYATFISSSLDSSMFFVQKEIRKDSLGSPEIREYFERGCVLIAIRENSMRSSEAENTVVMYR